MEGQFAGKQDQSESDPSSVVCFFSVTETKCPW